MQAIADDPECATEDEFELTGVSARSSATRGPCATPPATLIGRIDRDPRDHRRARGRARSSPSSSRPSRTSCAPRSRASSASSSCCCTTTSTKPTSKRYLTDGPRRGAAPHGADRRLPRRPADRGRALHARARVVRARRVARRSRSSSTRPSPRAPPRVRVPDEPLAMVGDRDRIGQVISNLLSNAIKYSPARRHRDDHGDAARGLRPRLHPRHGPGHPRRPAEAGLQALLPRRTPPTRARSAAPASGSRSARRS